MVAADFTLYSNPINKMLYRPVNAEPEPPPSTSSSSSSPPSAPQAAVKPAPEPASSPAAASASSTSGDNETAKTVRINCVVQL
jgi:hypothetical protein